MNPKDICFICGGAEIRAADRSCLSDIWFANIFSLSLICLFIFLMLKIYF
jgi:hypothetical protein